MIRMARQARRLARETRALAGGTGDISARSLGEKVLGKRPACGYKGRIFRVVSTLQNDLTARCNAVTSSAKTEDSGQENQRPSLLPFDPGDLVAMRVLPAQFARMAGVSKQTVSQWIKRGIVELGPDGRLEPRKASRQVIERTDPARLRARVFRHASASLEELRARVRELESELDSERQLGARREEAATFRANDEAVRRLDRLIVDLARSWNEAEENRRGGRWESWSQELIAVEFHGLDLEEYRRMWLDDGGDEAAAEAVA